MNTIRTPWAEKVNKDCPLSEYPRPQMVRESYQCLNGRYEYAITKAGAGVMGNAEGEIIVPFALECELSGVEGSLKENEALWYRRKFTVDENYEGKRVLLHFGAVDWKSEVYVNGKLVGEHIGGYCPFSFDITDFLAEENELVVKVIDPTEKGTQPRGKQISKPVGFWYTSTSGIWQTVWLEVVPETYINSLRLTPDIDTASLAVEVNFNGEATVRVTAYDGDNAVATATFDKNGKLDISDMKLWSPESPFLYDLKVELMSGDKVVDEVKSYFGMRKYSMKRDSKGKVRLCLNNEPYFQKGLLDQGYWPDGGMTAPTDEALIYDIEKMRDLGYNMLRKHIKVEPARWYYHCDRLGMLVWQDMPSIADNSSGIWGNRAYDTGTDSQVTEEGKANYYKEWSEIIEAFKPFPCIVSWVPFNEAWGQFDTEEVVKFTRALDPTRLINYASGGNFIKCSGDILDLHNYPHPEMYLYDKDYINILGEYGGIGWPVEGHLWQPDQNWGYIQYKSEEEVLATYEKYAIMLTYLVDWGFSSAIYTQLTDVEGEVNGLMTYDRKVMKLDIDRLNEINTMVINSLK